MQLPRSRTALRQATQAVEELRAAKNDSELFRDRCVSTMGMVLRVGSIVDDETRGNRTPEFGMWWAETKSDPLHVFMQDVRNAEFKRGEARQAAHHYVTLGEAVEVESALSITVIQGGKVVQQGGVPEEPAPRIEPSPAPTDSHRIEWFFRGGGEFDNHEVLSTIDRYLAWLREEVLPTAERLQKLAVVSPVARWGRPDGSGRDLRNGSSPGGLSPCVLGEASVRCMTS
jgi:hypothetical protein